MRPQVQIFLSYARLDQKHVEDLYQKLSQEGLKPWMDRKDILPGEIWESVIQKAIKESEFFLACLSRRSINRRGLIQKEIKDALDSWKAMLESDIYLIPVRMEDCEVPESLRSFQWVDLFEEDGWTRLRDAIQVGLERRLQQTIEEKLLVKSLSDMATVADRLNSITYNPFDMLTELKTALQHFDQVSQNVNQYFALHSLNRKREALNRALDAVEVLRENLLISKTRLSSRLAEVADQWIKLLSSEQDDFCALSEDQPEIPNPFVFGPPIRETKDNVFVGRRDIVREIEDSILGPVEARTILLYGPRRIGKSSLLNQLPRLLGSNFALANVDCQNPAATGSVTTLLRFLSRSLSKGLCRCGVITEGLTADMLSGEPFAAFDDWLDEIERTTPKTMHVLFCLDEYERLHRMLDAKGASDLLDYLQHTVQHRPRIGLAFTGVLTFPELGSLWTDRFIDARRFKLSFLKREEVLPLLTQPIPEFAVKYATGSLEALFATTNGHPFLTQVVAFELVRFLNEQRRKEATLDDVEQAITRALESSEVYFTNVWNDAGEQGQAILRSMAKGETLPAFPTARAWLFQQDIVDGTGSFAMPLLKRWIEDKART